MADSLTTCSFFPHCFTLIKQVAAKGGITEHVTFTLCSFSEIDILEYSTKWRQILCPWRPGLSQHLTTESIFPFTSRKFSWKCCPLCFRWCQSCEYQLPRTFPFSFLMRSGFCQMSSFKILKKCQNLTRSKSHKTLKTEVDLVLFEYFWSIIFIIWDRFTKKRSSIRGELRWHSG